MTNSLSKRELEILALIAEGFSNKRAAGALFISEPTVKKHVTNILWKLDAVDRTHAVVLAHCSGKLAFKGCENGKEN